MLPATDDRLRTWIATANGPLPFQEWFVARQHREDAEGVHFEGAEADPYVQVMIGDVHLRRGTQPQALEHYERAIRGYRESGLLKNAIALCKKMLAEHLGCAPEELPRRGFIVLSAGLSAMMGGSAAAEAVETTLLSPEQLTDMAVDLLLPGLVHIVEVVTEAGGSA